MKTFSLFFSTPFLFVETHLKPCEFATTYSQIDKKQHCLFDNSLESNYYIFFARNKCLELKHVLVTELHELQIVQENSS